MKAIDGTTAAHAAADSGAVWMDLYAGAGLRLVRADYAPGFRHARHDHSYGVLTLILAGSLRERVGAHEVIRGTLALTARRAGVEHACDWGERGARVLSLEIDPEVLPESEWDRVARAPWSWVVREESARSLIAMYRSAARGRLHAEAEDLLLEALAMVDGERPVGAGEAPPWVPRARDALLARGPKPRTRELAEDAGVHPVHFARVFRRHLGCSPTEMARRGRLQAASETLAWDRGGEIGRASYRCGYYDHSHMCRELRESLGVTPTVLRGLARPVRGAVAAPRR